MSQTILKNIEMNNAVMGIIEFKKNKIKLPTKVAWNINKNFNKLTTALKEYYEEQNIIVSKYGIKNENGEILDAQGGYTIPNENIKLYSEEMNELNMLEDTVDLLMINLSDLEDLEVDLVTLEAISCMIIDE